MDFLVIRAVVPGLRTSAGTATFFTGYVTLVRNQDFRGAVSGDDLQAISFFVPDSVAFTEPPAAIGVELSLRRIKSSPNPGMVTFGVSDESVAVAPDPRGGPHHWLQITFQTPIYSHALVEINYRVTVQTA